VHDLLVIANRIELLDASKDVESSHDFTAGAPAA
jgi:hypothetical protein